MKKTPSTPRATPRRCAVSTGSVAGRDPRIGGLSREDAFRIKAFAESIGAADCMPAWMALEIAEKTSSPADGKPQNNETTQRDTR